MPYIDPKFRKDMDEIVDFMIAKGIKDNGKLNYVLYKLCLHIVEPSYNNFKNYLGELNETGEEIRRRLLAPYEDEKARENGDVTL